jgi:UDP-glucose 4-epimerase
VPALSGALAGVKVYQANYNKTIIEDIFKQHRFDAVLHLGRVGNLKMSIGKRFDLNVVGSQKIMDLCITHGVRRLTVLSTFHIYGAHPANHIPIVETDPLHAGTSLPQLADAIQLDSMACIWAFRHPEVRTVVLRPTNVIGPTIRNAMSMFLRGRHVPHVLGFNPMVQLIDAGDLAAAVLAAVAGERTGIYNIAGADAAPWRTILELARARTFPVPSGLVKLFLRATADSPAYLIDFFKHPCIISDDAFRRDFAWAPRVSLVDSVWSTVADARSAVN